MSKVSATTESIKSTKEIKRKYFTFLVLFSQKNIKTISFSHNWNARVCFCVMPNSSPPCPPMGPAARMALINQMFRIHATTNFTTCGIYYYTQRILNFCFILLFLIGYHGFLATPHGSTSLLDNYQKKANTYFYLQRNWSQSEEGQWRLVKTELQVVLSIFMLIPKCIGIKGTFCLDGDQISGNLFVKWQRYWGDHSRFTSPTWRSTDCNQFPFR